MAATSTPELEHAARIAIEAAYIELVAMLMAGEVGEVAIVVGFNRLEPQARPVKKGRAVKVERGHWAAVEVIG